MWNRVVPFLALVPPVVAGLLLFQGLVTWRPPSSLEDQRLMGNAGRVLNGRITQMGVVAEMDLLLAAHEPRLLILGNSLANTNLDTSRMAEGLGVAENKILTLSVPNSVSSHWYAILEHRVYEANYQPGVVLIVAGLQSLLMVEPYSEASYEDLMIQLDSHEPVLGRFIDLEHPELRTLMRNRVLVRDLAMNTIRDNAVGLFFAGGSAANSDAMNRLFSDENIDMGRHLTATPAAGGENMDDGSVEGLPTAAESLVEDLARLAQQNGSTLVFVRPPMKPWTPEDRKDLVSAKAEEEIDAILARYGHAYLDMTDVRLPPRAFKNLRHYSPEGAQIFTDAVVEEIKPMWQKQRRGRR